MRVQDLRVLRALTNAFEFEDSSASKRSFQNLSLAVTSQRQVILAHHIDVYLLSPQLKLTSKLEASVKDAHQIRVIKLRINLDMIVIADFFDKMHLFLRLNQKMYHCESKKVGTWLLTLRIDDNLLPDTKLFPTPISR